MESAPNMYEGLYQAALVSQDPRSPPSQIAQAVQFVEQVKAQDVNAVLQAASQLAQPQQPLEVQVAGLSLLHQQVQSRWKQMTVDAQTTLAGIANSLFAQAAMSAAAWVVKGKAAQLLASVSTHQGPDAFRTLAGQLLAVGPQGDAAQVELACLVLQYTTEDVTSFEEVNGAAKKGLLSAVTASSPAVLMFSTQVLQHHMTLAYQLQNQGDQASAQRSLGAVMAAFRVVSSYVEWAPLKSVAESGLVPALLPFMQLDEFRMPAMDVLKQITARKYTNEPEDVYVPFMGSFASALVSIADAILKTEYLTALDFGGSLEEFGIRLCGTMTNFSEMHFRCVTKPEDKLMFIRQMLKFVEHPYLHLAWEALQFWMGYLQKLMPAQHGSAASANKTSPPRPPEGKKGTSRGVPPPKASYLIPYDPPDDIWNELALAMTGHMMRVVLVPDIEVEPPEYFETAQEHREFCANFRGRVKLVMRGTSARAPFHALQCTAQFLQFCIERANSEQPKPRLLQHLEAAVFCLEAVMGSLTEHAERDRLLPGISQLLQALMQYRNPMPAAILLHMRGLEAFAKPLEFLPSMALPLVETGLNLMQSIPLTQNGQLPPPSPLTPEMKEASNARLMCSKLLFTLALDAPKAFAPHLQTIAQRTERLHEEGKLQEGERVQLCEGMLCVSGALGLDSQQMVLDWMLKPIHAKWTSQEWRAHCGSAQDFAKSLLPWQLDATGKPDIGARELRWSLYNELALIERCIRRIPEAPPLEENQTTPPPHPWNTHLEWVLIPVLQLTACLHGLWTPEMRAQLQPIVGALEMDPREKAVRLKGDVMEAKKEVETVSVAGTGVVAVRSWLQGLRDMCYMIVFGASAHCPAFWLCRPVAAFMASTLFAHLESMEHRHLRTILRHILLLWITSCPKALRDQWLLPVLAPLIPHMHTRLSQSWSQLARATTAPSGSDQQLSQEQLEESVLRDVSKEYMEALLRMIRHNDRVDGDPNAQAQEHSSCIDFLMERDNQLVLTSMATATDSLGWPDFEIARRALMYLRLFIPKVGMRVPSIDLLAGATLRAVITALSNQIFLPVQPDLLTVARAVCVTYMQHTQHVRQQLQLLPKITPEVLANFEVSFFSSQIEKYQRDLFKALLVETGNDALKSLLLVHGPPIPIKPASVQQREENMPNGNGDGFQNNGIMT